MENIMLENVNLYKITGFNNKQISLTSNNGVVRNISLPDFDIDISAVYLLTSGNDLITLKDNRITNTPETINSSINDILYLGVSAGNLDHIYFQNAVYCCRKKIPNYIDTNIMPWYFIDNMLYYDNSCSACNFGIISKPEDSKISGYSKSHIELIYTKSGKETCLKITKTDDKFAYEEYLSPEQLIKDANELSDIEKLQQKLIKLQESVISDDTNNKKMDNEISLALEIQKTLENSMNQPKKNNKEILLELLTQNLDEILKSVNEKDQNVFVSIALRMAEILTE